MIIYRFSSGLFFANAKVLVRDIEDHLKHDTKAVIIDAGAIGSIGITDVHNQSESESVCLD